MTGTLYLVPTPINDESVLDAETKDFVEAQFREGATIAVEEMKEGRRRWLRFGLPREAIEKFELYNEHTREEAKFDLVARLKKGQNVLLMSDCGLPAFCDPGAELVSLCHESKLRVSSTSYPNSISLALALSGFSHDRFLFEGFLPKKNPERKERLKKIIKEKMTTVIMDTPYRLKATLEELAEYGGSKDICLCMDLNKPEEQIIRASAKEVNAKVAKTKKEFVIVLGDKL